MIQAIIILLIISHYKSKMIRVIRFAILTVLIILGTISLSAQSDVPRINVINVTGAINPVVADYVQRGIRETEESGASALIIQMDTPGGLDNAMREIVQAITGAQIPVIVYVAPPGARAASAGTFITLSAHVAAMSTNTVIGAAHPVGLGGEEIPDESEQKIVNDAAAYIRSIAESKGRNADWAERAVRESVSITETEALGMEVIDIVAPTMESLLTQLNGREVTLIDGSSVTLDTAKAATNNLGMSWIESFLNAISEPNIAYILLSIGSLGIIAEIFNPGLIFPGVTGAICLLLAFFSLGTLPVNWTGVLLILLGFGLFVGELFTAGFGLLFGGGLVSFILGSLILFQGGSPLFQLDWWLIAVVSTIIAVVVAVIILLVVKAHREQATTGKEDIRGNTAVVRQTLDPEGTVFFQGELWSAISKSGRIESGEEVIITEIKGLKLSVIKKAKE